MSKAEVVDVFVTSVGTKVGVVSTGVTANSIAKEQAPAGLGHVQ